MDDFHPEDYEILLLAHVGQETPRIFLLKMTGHDFAGLKHPGEERDLTWEEVRGPTMQIMMNILMHSTCPTLIARKKKKQNDEQ